MKSVVVIDRLTRVVPNKYEAIRVMAKEARRINSVILRSENWESTEKPTTLAMKRLLENRLKYDFVQDESKKVDGLTFGEEE